MIELNKIYNEDCLDGMKRIPDSSVDMILADPPYNISVENNLKTMGRSGIDFGDWDKQFDLIGWIKIACQSLKKGGTIIIFNDWKNLGYISKELEKNNIVVKDMIRWEKTNPMPRNRDRRYICDFEVAVVGVKKSGAWTFNRKNETYDRGKMIYPIVSGKEKTIHSTQKPIALFNELILRHSNENEVVLDPFIGSGTTAISCLNTDRNFIGFELNKEYFEIAQNRIKERQSQSNLFDVETLEVIE